MSEINNISINIALNTLPLSQKGFGMPLIVGIKVRAGKPDYVEVADADELLDASIGFTSTDAEYKMAAAIFSQSPRMDKVAVAFISQYAAGIGVGLVEELAALRNSGKDNWYWLLITDRTKENIAIADAYVNTLEKVGVFASADQTITSTGERTVILISNHADEYPDAAWVGRCGAVPIGSISWDSKQLNGQQNSGVTMSEQSTLLAGNFNLIREMGGVPVTWEGKTISGQYIDNINGRDFLKARLTEAFQSLKINSNKLPMDLNGLAMIEAKLREVFRDAGRQGVIAPVVGGNDKDYSDMGDYQYKLSLPEDISAISINDRANRKVSAITFSAKVGGGINKIEINGTLEV